MLLCLQICVPLHSYISCPPPQLFNSCAFYAQISNNRSWLPSAEHFIMSGCLVLFHSGCPLGVLTALDFFFFFKIYLFLFFGCCLCCCTWAFSSCGKWGLLSRCMRGLLIEWASHWVGFSLQWPVSFWQSPDSRCMALAVVAHGL